MTFIIDSITKGIWKFFAEMFASIIEGAFKLITDTIISLTDVNKYLDINKYLVYIQIVAGALLLVKLAWECLRYQTNGALGGNNKSFSDFIFKTIASGAGIYILPQLVLNILIPANNYLIGIIQGVGIEIKEKNFMGILDMSPNLVDLGQLMIIVSLVMAIGFLVLAIAGGIRYIELVICILFAPIAAISFTTDSEGVQVWLKETICIIFTQAIHILLLQILIAIITEVEGPMMAVLTIGTIAVMLKGPQILRNFLYTSGVGGAAVGATGHIARLAMMSKISKMATPISE